MLNIWFIIMFLGLSAHTYTTFQFKVTDFEMCSQLCTFCCPNVFTFYYLWLTPVQLSSVYPVQSPGISSILLRLCWESWSACTTSAESRFCLMILVVTLKMRRNCGLYLLKHPFFGRFLIVSLRAAVRRIIKRSQPTISGLKWAITTWPHPQMTTRPITGVMDPSVV